MPAQYPLDALGTLLPLSWRGIEAPCQANDVAVSQRNVKHTQWRVSAAHVENCGRESATFSFRVLFRGGISGYSDLYPTRFREFFNACLDGSAGKLVHPEFGELDAVCDSIRVAYDPNRRDGVDVDAVWSETNESDFVLEKSYLMASAVSLAAQLDGNFPDVDIPTYYDGTGLSLTEAMKAIQGNLLLAQMSVASVLADVANAINGVNALIDGLSSLADPKASLALQYAKDIEAALNALAERLPGMRATRSIVDRVVRRAQTVADAAAFYGMSMDDWFTLNPMTAATGSVKIGDIVFVYSS